MADTETDEVAQSWTQLLQLIIQLLHRYHHLLSDGSMKLTRQQHQQLLTQAREVRKQYTLQAAITRDWYDARLAQYQHVSAQIRTNLTAPQTTAADRQHAQAYLAGLRAGIEHTVHHTLLTSEQRGQVVQALDQIDDNPHNPLQGSVFQPLTPSQAVAARHAAAASEYRIDHQTLGHQDQQTVDTARHLRTAAVAADKPVTIPRAQARVVDELIARVDHIEAQLADMHPQPTPTADSASATTATSENDTSAPCDNQHPSARAGVHAEAEPARTTVWQKHIHAEHDPESDPAAPSEDQARADQADTADPSEPNDHDGNGNDSATPPAATPSGTTAPRPRPPVQRVTQTASPPSLPPQVTQLQAEA